MTRNTSPQFRLLFVCLGNICRSPAAEAVMKHVVEAHGESHRFLIDSAGIGPWHVGQLPDARMRAAAGRRGYSLNSRGRQVKAYDFDDFDLILAMDDDNVDALNDRAPTVQDQQKIHLLSEYLPRHLYKPYIPDPYYGGSSGFEQVLDLVEAACEGLYQHLMASR